MRRCLIQVKYRWEPSKRSGQSHGTTRPGGSRAGYEIEHPLAVVILGGLVTSTLLNLFVVPALYLRFGKTDRFHPGVE